MAIIDFTNGRWGHAIHGATFHPAKAAKLVERLKDWWLSRRRYTVLVHSECPIMPGDHIRYRAADGIRQANVVSVDWKLDPRDMAMLEIMLTQPSKDGGGDE